MNWIVSETSKSSTEPIRAFGNQARTSSFGLIVDHGRGDWLGCWVKFVQKASFKKLVCLRHIKKNNLTYLGRICTPCLSVATGIYGLIYFEPRVRLEVSGSKFEFEPRLVPSSTWMTWIIWKLNQCSQEVRRWKMFDSNEKIIGEN